MPFSLASVDWVYVAILALLVFISTWVGSLLSFKNSGRAAVLSAVLFADCLFSGPIIRTAYQAREH